jgi:type III secretory pathway component EscU
MNKRSIINFFFSMIIKNWTEFKNWLESKNPNMFLVVWSFAWRWLIIQVLVAFVFVVVLRFLFSITG